MTPEARRTQAERSAETIGKLLDATAACLVERGYAATSTPEVCRRAGVSRGALVHHFPTKDDLVAAAIAHIVDLRVEEFRAAMATVPPGADLRERLETAIDVLWGIFRGETATAWIELAVAARTDPALRDHLHRVGELLDDRVREAWADLFTDADEVVDGYLEVAPTYLMTLLNGLAVQRIEGADDAPEKAAQVITATKLILRTMLDADPQTLTDHVTDLLADDPNEGTLP